MAAVWTKDVYNAYETAARIHSGSLPAAWDVVGSLTCCVSQVLSTSTAPPSTRRWVWLGTVSAA